jgi:hypothetical protein
MQWRAAADRAARELGIQLDVHQVGRDQLTDSAGEFAAAYDLSAGGGVIVRPDGFVGWRASSYGDEGDGAVTRALSRLVGKGGSS